jgi:hypothetical protein
MIKFSLEENKMPTRKTPPKPASQKTESKQVTPRKPAPRKTPSKKVVAPPAPEEGILPQEQLPAGAPAEPEEPASAASAPVNPVAPVPPVKPVAPVPPMPPVPPVPAVAPVSPQLSQSQWERPGKVQAIAIMTLLNGILNILYGLMITAVVVLGTLFIGIICSWLTILPTVLGIFEVIYAAKLLANPPQPVKPSKTIAILEIVAVLAGNIVSAVVWILVLVFYDDPAVKGFFARLNRHA